VTPAVLSTIERARWWRTPLRVFAGMAIGGFGFWGTSIIWHLVRGDRFRGRDAIGLTVVLPLLMWLVGRLMQRRIPEGRASTYMPIAALGGIWAFGPVAFLAWVGVTGGGEFLLASPLGWGAMAFTIVVFPATTFMVATYDGSLGALIFSTLVLILVAAAGPARPREQAQRA
jgi:hypothetical protein